MKKIAAILRNKDILNRILFTFAIFLIFRIGSAITIPGVTVSDNAFSSGDILGLMNLMGGGSLQSFSLFALGVSPYITSQIIVQLLQMDVLPKLTELGYYPVSQVSQLGVYLIDLITDLIIKVNQC